MKFIHTILIRPFLSKHLENPVELPLILLSWPREVEDRSLRHRLPSDASAAHVANNVHPRSNSMLKDTGNDQGNCRHLYTKA